jgi:hypothetical protein
MISQDSGNIPKAACTMDLKMETGIERWLAAPPTFIQESDTF